MIIKKIYIKNFRSIQEIEIIPSILNSFVGLNDVGKSNLLKALNLFFNNETDYDKSFEFDNDFSKWAKVAAKKAREIVIRLNIEMPESFKETQNIIWEKRWRQDGLHSEKIIKKDGKNLPPYSKVQTKLNRTKYYYVPAIKSSNYFKYLTGHLYSSLYTNDSIDLKSASDKYSNVLQHSTKEMNENIRKMTGLDSILTMPKDQTEIFKALIFETDSSGERIPLDSRGDGVKARHIPSILKFITELENNRYGVSVQPSFIWGYEEPENGVEMSKCFEMYDELKSYSNGIQMFITTHSPAFYRENGNDMKCFFVTKNEEAQITEFSDEARSYIDEKLGLLVAVAPYIKKTNEERDSMRKELHNYKNELEKTLLDKPTIFVEGKEDKKYLQRAIEIFSEELKYMLDNNNLQIYVDLNNPGCSGVHKNVLGWCHLKYMSNSIALFDADKAGLEARRKLVEEIEKYKFNLKTTSVPKSLALPKNDLAITLNQNHINYYYEIEHYLPIYYWEENKNFVYEEESYNCWFAKNCPADISQIDFIKKVLDDESMMDFLCMRIKSDKKEIFCNQSIEKSKKDESLFGNFEKLIRLIEKSLLNN